MIGAAPVRKKLTALKRTAALNVKVQRQDDRQTARPVPTPAMSRKTNAALAKGVKTTQRKLIAVKNQQAASHP